MVVDGVPLDFLGKGEKDILSVFVLDVKKQRAMGDIVDNVELSELNPWH
jgi:hypothetical protein